METPEWNAKDKAGSIRNWIVQLLDEARRQFLLAGTHVEIFFIFGDEGLMEIVPVAGMEKEEVRSALRRLLEEREGYAYIHLVEAAARKLDGDASDSLLLIAESREGLSEVWFNTVVERNEEKLLLDAVKVDGARIDGRFVGLFEGL